MSTDALRSALLDFYDAGRRDLPWRRSPDPYGVWVSEVMLQQTRVDTVVPYYERWMRRFPDVEAVADAALDEVLLLWEGLGYYRRARHLHRAARVVRERHGGALPGSYGALRALPGVGEYTAGAVASIAFGEVVPAVDGNARRVLSRLFDLADPRPAELRELAARLVDPRRPGDWNQAVMELGATVCVPRTPRCGICPVAMWCRALEHGRVAQRPAPPRRARVRAADFAALALVRAGQVLLVRRPAEGLLGGMWSLPVVKIAAGGSALDVVRASGDGVGGDGGAAVEVGGEGGTCIALEPVRHRFTHLDATYRPVLVRLGGARGAAAGTSAAPGTGAVAVASALTAASCLDGPGHAAPNRDDGHRAGRMWVDPRGPVPVALPVAQRTILDGVAAFLDHGSR